MLEQELLAELKNVRVELQKLNRRQKNVFLNFLGGMFSAIGSAFGTIVVISGTIYILSQLKINLVTPMTKLIEDSMSRINWQKIMPKPQIIDLKTLNLNNSNSETIQQN